MNKTRIEKNHIPDRVVLNALLAYGTDIVIVITNNFRIENINAAGEKFYQWTLETVRGKSFLTLCKKQKVNCPISEHFFKHPEWISINIDGTNAAKNPCTLHWVISPLLLSNDEVAGALIVGKDIERKKNNIAYYLNGIIEAIPGCLYWKDCNGYYLGCNNLTAKLAGLSSPYEVVGKTDAELWGEQAAVLIRNDKEVITQGETIVVEEQLKTASGQWVYFTGVKMPLRDENNQIIGLIGNSLDITELKKTQAELKNSMELAESANQAKTEFLANMRHDIRTPLSGIVGFSEILKQESQEPHIKEYADNLVASSHALLHLMDEVLEAVRVSSGEIPMLKRKFNLSATLNHIMDLYAAKAREKQLTLTLVLDSKVPHYVIGDKIRVHRIAMELIGNALNFTDKGSVTLNVLLAKQENGRLVIKMTVADTGIGMPKDKQQEIYLQFKRLTPSYKGIYQGAGLGLFVIKQFIDELNGEIYVTSEPHKGTCFTCLIPLQESLLDDDFGIDSEDKHLIEKPYLTPLREQQKVTGEPKCKASKRILLVEDNGIAQMAAKTLLYSLSCQVDIAHNGMEALSFCKKNTYDLIFMDIGLGEGMDGYEVTHHIRSMPHTKSLPIIALTAHGSEENRQRCIEAGMSAVLTKPLTLKNCTDILEAFIIKSRTQEESNKNNTHPFELSTENTSWCDITFYPVLDIEEGIKTAGTLDVLAQMLHLMIHETLPTEMHHIKQAYEANDWDKIQRIAHKIKGGAVYVGTVKIKMACHYLDLYWKSGQRALLDTLYQQTMAALDESIREITHWLTSH